MNHNANTEYKNIELNTDSKVAINSYALFLTFASSQISKKIKSLIDKTNYKDSAYWNSILFYLKNDITINDKTKIGNKWLEAIKNGYNIKTWVKNKIDNFDISNKEPASSEEETRLKTINRILNNFKGEMNSLIIPDLEVKIYDSIEINVVLILSNYSPKWNNKNVKDVVDIINEFRTKINIIKTKWLEEFNTNSTNFLLGLNKYVENYIKTNIFNSFTRISNNLLSSIVVSTNWIFKNNYTDFDIDALNKTQFTIDEVQNQLINNFKNKVKEFLKLDDISKITFSNLILSKSNFKRNKNNFGYYQYYLDAKVELILGTKKVIKNIKFLINNVVAYNPIEEFTILINNLVDDINAKKTFKIENIDLLKQEINTIEKLITFFKNNGVELNNIYLVKLLQLSIRFSTFRFQNLKINFQPAKIDIEFILHNGFGSIVASEFQHRNIKLELDFFDDKKNKTSKIITKNLNIHSKILLAIKELEKYYKNNKIKYLFRNEWNQSNDRKPEDLYPNNSEWKTILDKIQSLQFSYLKESTNSFIYFQIYANLDWKYESTTNPYVGWKTKDTYSVLRSISEKFNADSQKDYMFKWIKEKLIVQKDVNKEILESMENNNLEYNANDFFANINELNEEVHNLKIQYRSRFKVNKNPKKYYVEFQFYKSSGKLLYTIEKDIWEKVSAEELQKAKKDVEDSYLNSKDKLSKLKLKEKSKENNEKMDNLYKEVQFSKLTNPKIDKIKLQKILDDYKMNIYEMWKDILKQKYKEKIEEIKNLKGASEEEKKKLLKELEKNLIEKLKKLNDKNLNLNDLSKLLNSMDLDFSKVLNSKLIISKTFKYTLITSAGILGIGSLASGGAIISLIKSKKKFRKSKLKIKSRKGLILFTTFVGLVSAIGSVGLSLFVFVSQGGF